MSARGGGICTAASSSASASAFRPSCASSVASPRKQSASCGETCRACRYADSAWPRWPVHARSFASQSSASESSGAAASRACTTFFAPSKLCAATRFCSSASQLSVVCCCVWNAADGVATCVSVFPNALCATLPQNTSATAASPFHRQDTRASTLSFTSQWRANHAPVCQLRKGTLSFANAHLNGWVYCNLEARESTRVQAGASHGIEHNFIAEHLFHSGTGAPFNLRTLAPPRVSVWDFNSLSHRNLDVHRVHDIADRAGEKVRPAMRKHHWAQRLPQVRRNPKCQSHAEDHQHLFRALVAVRRPKEHSLNHYARPDAPSKEAKLPLKIAAENVLLEETRRRAQRNPQRKLRQRVRHEFQEHASARWMQQETQYSVDYGDQAPHQRRDADVANHCVLFHPDANPVAHRRARAQALAPQHK